MQNNKVESIVYYGIDNPEISIFEDIRRIWNELQKIDKILIYKNVDYSR